MKHLLAAAMIAFLAGCATIGANGSADLVEINADGRVQLNGRNISIASLSDSFKTDRVVIDAHPSVPYSKVKTVLEEAAEAGITNVSLKTK